MGVLCLVGVALIAIFYKDELQAKPVEENEQAQEDEGKVQCQGYSDFAEESQSVAGGGDAVQRVWVIYQSILYDSLFYRRVGGLR